MKKDDEAGLDLSKVEDGCGADSHDDDEDKEHATPKKWQKMYMKSTWNPKP